MRVPAGGALGPALEVAHHVHPSRKVLWTRCTCHPASAVTSRGPPHTRSGFEANLRGDFHHKYFSTCLFQRKGILSGEKQQPQNHYLPCLGTYCCVRNRSKMEWLGAVIHSSLCYSAGGVSYPGALPKLQ